MIRKKEEEEKKEQRIYDLSSIMVLRKGICSLFIPLKLCFAVYFDTGFMRAVTYTRG